MREKFFARRDWDDDLLLGIMFDEEKGQVTVGGSVRFLDTMLAIVTLFTQSHEEVIRHNRSHRTKVRSTPGVTREVWLSGLDVLRDRQWRLRETRTFRRLMT